MQTKPPLIARSAAATHTHPPMHDDVVGQERKKEHPPIGQPLQRKRVAPFLNATVTAAQRKKGGPRLAAGGCWIRGRF